MQHRIDFHGRRIDLTITPAAEIALAKRQTPLLAEMELLFSSLIRKEVKFYETETLDCTPVTASLSLCFRPVTTRQYRTEYKGDETPLTELTIIHAEHYIPHWLNIDYKNGQWQGEFGYAPR